MALCTPFRFQQASHSIYLRWIICLGVLLATVLPLPALGEEIEFRVLRIELEPSLGPENEKRSGPDYYISGGKAEGIAPAMFLDVYRPRIVQDPFSGTSSEIRILVGQVKVLRVFDHLSVVRLYALESPEQSPLVTYRSVMIGDYLVPRAEGAPRPAQMSVPSNVFFDLSRWQLKAESSPILAELADILMHSPESRLVVTGHTCNLGSPEYNRKLSLKRAQAVADYLSMVKGIPRDRIEVAGQGAKSPISSNRTEEGRKKNRRVDFLLAPKETAVAVAERSF